MPRRSVYDSAESAMLSLPDRASSDSPCEVAQLKWMQDLSSLHREVILSGADLNVACLLERPTGPDNIAGRTPQQGAILENASLTAATCHVGSVIAFRKIGPPQITDEPVIHDNIAFGPGCPRRIRDIARQKLYWR